MDSKAVFTADHMTTQHSILKDREILVVSLLIHGTILFHPMSNLHILNGVAKKYKNGQFKFWASGVWEK